MRKKSVSYLKLAGAVPSGLEVNLKFSINKFGKYLWLPSYQLDVFYAIAFNPIPELWGSLDPRRPKRVAKNLSLR